MGTRLVLFEFCHFVKHHAPGPLLIIANDKSPEKVVLPLPYLDHIVSTHDRIKLWI